MCIGIPMQVIESGFGYAVCRAKGITREIDTLLVGEQPPGTWLLVFLQSAREILSEQDARKISDAIQAVDLIMGNKVSEGPLPMNTIDTLFSDLIDREPPKPDSLIALERELSKKD